MNNPSDSQHPCQAPNHCQKRSSHHSQSSCRPWHRYIHGPPSLSLVQLRIQLHLCERGFHLNMLPGWSLTATLWSSGTHPRCVQPSWYRHHMTPLLRDTRLFAPSHAFSRPQLHFVPTNSHSVPSSASFYLYLWRSLFHSHPALHPDDPLALSCDPIPSLIPAAETVTPPAPCRATQPLASNSSELCD
jgi:hypothetical protein